MKIIKTTLGWEIQPEDDVEESQLKWLIRSLELYESATDNERLQMAYPGFGPQCPQCGAFGCYNGEFCKWCQYKGGKPVTTQYRTGDNTSYRLRVPIE